MPDHYLTVRKPALWLVTIYIIAESYKIVLYYRMSLYGPTNGGSCPKMKNAGFHPRQLYPRNLKVEKQQKRLKSNSIAFVNRVGAEGFERRSRRRATFENKHILALQPLTPRIAATRIERPAERSDAGFVRMVRKTDFHAT